jgi:hypothetical protein
MILNNNPQAGGIIMKRSNQQSFLKNNSLKIFAVFILSGQFALAKLPAHDWKNFWESFNKNPQWTMQLIPEKTQDPKSRPPQFSEKEIQTKKYIQIKDSFRQKICQQSGADQNCQFTHSNYSGMPENGNGVGMFFPSDYKIIKNVHELDSKGISSAKSNIQPWSGDYWGTYRGGIAARYGLENFPDTEDWKEMEKAFDKYQPINKKSHTFLKNLSPAEKYDLLADDNKYTLTGAILESGRSYFKANGNLETWFGICHGWAPAAYVEPRPRKSFEISIGGNYPKMKIYPDDVKALVSQLWAENNFPTRFLGGRCDDKNPAMDPNGRIIAENCFDANPGLWHITLLNQLGLRGKSFVIDATYDYQVWNQPVASYSYQYFNPHTKEHFNEARLAMIPIESYEGDKFKTYRHKDSKQIVGVELTLNYVQETTANHTDIDNEEYDSMAQVTYLYDLEMDSEGNIIGGEWYQNAHPDMIWTPIENTKAKSSYDYLITTPWNGMGLLPTEWRKLAPYSSMEKSPLARVVEKLLDLSGAIPE